MKRLLLIGFLVTGPVFAQSSADDSFSRLFELMQERIQKSFGDFFSDDQNLNQMFDIGQDIFDQSSIGSMFKQDMEYEWVQEDRGRALIVKVSENNKLDVNVEDKVVMISGEIKTTKENKTQHGSSKSVSISSVREALPVPLDCDGSQVKQSSKTIDKKLVTKIFFPYKSGKPGNPGHLPNQKSFNISDFSKSFPKNFPQHRKTKRSQSPSKAQAKKQNSKEEMIPLFNDGDEI